MSISKTSKSRNRTAPRSAPRGLDYVPVGCAELGFGVVRRTLAGKTNDAREFVWKKLHPVRRSASWTEAWRPSAARSDVLLPAAAPDALSDPFALCRAYEEASWSTVKDLVIVITFRLGDGRLHTQFEHIRSFVRHAFCEQRQLPAILALHTPRASGVDRAAHVHVMVLPRRLGEGFGTFADTNLCSDRGAPLIAAEWAAWSQR